VKYKLNDLPGIRKVELGDGDGKKPSPNFSNGQICFNGMGEDAHETFILYKQLPKTRIKGNKEKYHFDFCKTARKPYDIMVCACLILYKHYFPNEVWISSDGNINEGEWKDAFELIAYVFPTGKEIGLPLLLDEAIFAKHPEI
jgi:hypothetical protein